jgi:hypothetical protein
MGLYSSIQVSRLESLHPLGHPMIVVVLRAVMYIIGFI